MTIDVLLWTSMVIDFHVNDHRFNASFQASFFPAVWPGLSDLDTVAFMRPWGTHSIAQTLSWHRLALTVSGVPPCALSMWWQCLSAG